MILKKTRLTSLFAALVGIIFCGASISWAAQTALLPSDDAYVNEQNTNTQNTVYGDGEELRAASQSGDKNKRTFLKFDLSIIPDGCEIDEASLELYLFEIAGGQSRAHQLHFVADDAWTETSLTWINQPAGSTLLSTADTGTTAGATVVWGDSTLAEQIATEYEGDNTISLRIKDASENATGNKEGHYASKEHPTHASPKLIVTYTCGDQEGCSHGFWKNHQDEWPVYYAPSDKLSEHFSNIPSELILDTLEIALDYGGGNGFIGGAKILLRNAVASLLNAADPDVNFPWSEDDVIKEVNAALLSGDRGAATKLETKLDILNNLGCPLGD